MPRLNPHIRKESVTPRACDTPPDAFIELANGKIDPIRTICLTSATPSGRCETNRFVSVLLRDMGFEMSWVFDERTRVRTAIYAQFANESLAKRAYYKLNQAIVPWNAADRFVARRVTDGLELQRILESTTRIFVNLGPEVYRGRPLATNMHMSTSEAHEVVEYFVELWCASPPRRDEDVITYITRRTGMSGPHAWRIVRPTWYVKSDVLTEYDLTDFIAILMRLIS